MTRAIRIHQTGGPEVLQWEEIEVGDPGPGQVRLQQQACGLNYIDVYGRSGMYPVGDLPAILGMEAIGTIDALGLYGAFTPDASQILSAAPIEGIAVLDHIPPFALDEAFLEKRLIVLDGARLVADSIARMHSNRSLSSLFVERDAQVSGAPASRVDSDATSS